MGPPFWTLIWRVIWDPDLGGDMGPTFRTPILELMPNVISNIKQNSSDMNEIILAPCDVISNIKQNSSDINEIILAPCDAGYVQSCTGLKYNPLRCLSSDEQFKISGT
jgi:hypothetical protein